jgi:hypothetical protein
MSDSLNVALHSYRFWRDIGADVLIVALLVEFLIEAWWPEQPHKTYIGLSRRQAMTAAAFIVFAGVGIERIWGTLADDKSDEIRIHLEKYIAILEPRTFLFTSDSINRLVKTLKPFKGQRVAVVQIAVNPDEFLELYDTAFKMCSVFFQSGWLDLNGRELKSPSSCVLNSDPTSKFQAADDVWIDVDGHATKQTKDAGKALADSLSAIPPLRVQLFFDRPVGKFNKPVELDPEVLIVTLFALNKIVRLETPK